MKDPLYGNKVAGAVLSALLMIFGLPLLADSFFGGGGHGGAGHHGDDHAEPFPQYPVKLALTASAGEPEKPYDLGMMMANMTPSQGERAAGICKSCHTFNEGGNHLQGPNLWNIVNRPVAGVDSFKGYSAALTEFGGSWTYERLDAFIKNSGTLVPGTAMNQKIRKDEKRAQILVYLSTLSNNPAPFPAPLEAAAPVTEVDTTDQGQDGQTAEPHGTNEPHGDESEH